MELPLEGIQALLDGAMFGAIYALLGVGFTLVFGITRRLNLGYAAASVAGAYVGAFAGHLTGAPGPDAILIAIAAGGLFGVLVYFCCFWRTQAGGALASLTATFGMLLLIRAGIGWITDEVPVLFPDLADLGMATIGQFSVRADLIAVAAVCGVTAIVLRALMYRSRMGLAIRALSQQPQVAQLCGISVVGVSVATFAVTGLVGGVAVGMAGVAVGVLSTQLILPLTIKGLIVAVIGGLGSIRGAIVIGVAIGALENLSHFLRGILERDLYVMLLLFAFLLLRPQGLFGARHSHTPPLAASG